MATCWLPNYFLVLIVEKIKRSFVINGENYFQREKSCHSRHGEEFPKVLSRFIQKILNISINGDDTPPSINERLWPSFRDFSSEDDKEYFVILSRLIWLVLNNYSKSVWLNKLTLKEKSRKANYASMNGGVKVITLQGR